MNGRDNTVKRLREALDRRDPDAVRSAVNDVMENGRRRSLERIGRIDGEEVRILEAEIKRRTETGRPTSTLSKALAAATGDRLRAAAGLDAITEVPRPKSGGFTIFGSIKGVKIPPNATVVFLSPGGESIEGAPILQVSPDGSFAAALGADATQELSKLVSAAEGAKLALKVGKRIVSTSTRSVPVTSGNVFQATFVLPQAPLRPLR